MWFHRVPTGVGMPSNDTDRLVEEGYTACTTTHLHRPEVHEAFNLLLREGLHHRNICP